MRPLRELYPSPPQMPLGDDPYYSYQIPSPANNQRLAADTINGDADFPQFLRSIPTDEDHVFSTSLERASAARVIGVIDDLPGDEDFVDLWTSQLQHISNEDSAMQPVVGQCPDYSNGRADIHATMRARGLLDGSDAWNHNSILDLDSASAHFKEGTKMLMEIITSGAAGDYPIIISAFYFMYLYLTRRVYMDRLEIERLSCTAIDYIEKCSFDGLGNILSPKRHSAPSDTLECRDLSAPTTEQRCNSSMAARLIIWLYSEDSFIGFHGCGGDLSKRLSKNPGRLDRLRQISSDALSLNWGEDYPADEVLVDINHFHPIDMLIDMITLHHEIIERNNAYMEMSFTEASNKLDSEFSILEIKYASVFRLAASTPNENSEIWLNSGISIIIFHALQICWARCTGSSFGSRASPPTERALASLLTLAQRICSRSSPPKFERFHWALFIAGIETNDLLHREWILGKIAGVRLNMAITKVLAAKDRSGTISMATIRKLLSVREPVAVQKHNSNSYDTAKAAILKNIDDLDTDLQAINHKIHANPELCFEEFQAHNNLADLLESHNFTVTRHAYGIPTAFCAEFGHGGRVLTLCAEYDALPGIGHACGHNLIAVSSVASFFGIAAALAVSSIPGRVRLLGTPAEECGGGKIKLINSGAFNDVDASMMLHPVGKGAIPTGTTGLAYGTCLTGQVWNVEFTGKAAHAGTAPWEGINALDAAALAYSAVGLLRQQMRPANRIGLVIKDGGKKSNITTPHSTVECSIRTQTLKEAKSIKTRVENCFRGAALATGCEVTFKSAMDVYADLRSNETLCTEFTSAMSEFGVLYHNDITNKTAASFSTDMGNVSHVVPTFHGLFAIAAENGEANHTPEFTRIAISDEAYGSAIIAAKGMAITGWKFLADDILAKSVLSDFENDVSTRERE
ncbi:Amidohydrolase [Penicillium expansum]|uniref:Amidohydrolase n=1 Tax=Penicillium expansum TaxID=27334 RepID=A0A0A2K2F0_PENEN|nr:Amidohydrolase [Penicillium expansum]KGO61226.1 Amidohydrolase [Penicillium expansum]